MLLIRMPPCQRHYSSTDLPTRKDAANKLVPASPQTLLPNATSAQSTNHTHPHSITAWAQQYMPAKYINNSHHRAARP